VLVEQDHVLGRPNGRKVQSLGMNRDGLYQVGPRQVADSDGEKAYLHNLLL
jgi:hypothetical protein